MATDHSETKQFHQDLTTGRSRKDGILPCLWQQERDFAQQQRHERELLVFDFELISERLQPELQFGRSQSSQQQQSVQRLLCQGSPALVEVMTSEQTKESTIRNGSSRVQTHTSAVIV